ncbi:MAG TPA: hypothetical protein VLH86_05815 [Patescibacteria group bacterium]|nr:hypothetical protein [Patescibacteria group bacterium]
MAAVLAGAATRSSLAAPASGGVTISPAAPTLELKKGEQQATAKFMVTNNYPATITLHFAFEQSANNPLHVADPRGQLSLAGSDITLEPGKGAEQVLTLRDDQAMTPGSQSVDLVVSQQGVSGQNGVGVLPSMRLPVTLIKDDGAVTSLGSATIAGPSLAMGVPSAVNVTLHNTGNMNVIPRGVVTVESPTGAVLAKGVLNEASKAVSPGAAITLATKLTILGGATVPGSYTLRVSYGQGGDAAAQTAATQFVFVAWWHIAVVLAFAYAGWFIVRHPDRFRRKPHRKEHAPPKRPLLIGRDIT